MDTTGRIGPDNPEDGAQDPALDQIPGREHMRKLLGATALACMAAMPVWAQGYFEGKNVTYIIATNPGGGYDAYGRLIGKYLEEALVAL